MICAFVWKPHTNNAPKTLTMSLTSMDLHHTKDPPLNECVCAQQWLADNFLFAFAKWRIVAFYSVVGVIFSRMVLDKNFLSKWINMQDENMCIVLTRFYLSARARVCVGMRGIDKARALLLNWLELWQMWNHIQPFYECRQNNNNNNKTNGKC